MTKFWPPALLVLLFTLGCETPNELPNGQSNGIYLTLADSQVYVGDTVVASVSFDAALRNKLGSLKWTINGERQNGDTVIAFIATEIGEMNVFVELSDINGEVLARDSEVVQVLETPAFRITLIEGGQSFSPTKFQVSLRKPPATILFRWSFGDGAVDTTSSPESSYIYYATGPHLITCTAFDSFTREVFGSDTLSLNLTSPSIMLDWTVLRSFTKVEVLFVGRSIGDWWDSGNSGEDHRTLYGLTLPLNDGSLTWNDTGAVYTFGNLKRDTVDNGGNTSYGYEERTQRVNISINGNTLRSAFVKKTDNHGFSESGYSSAHKSINEFKLSNFDLIHQSADSVVFAMGGETLKDNFYMYSEDSDTQSPNPYFESGRKYRSTDFKSLTPRPLCRVRFFR